MIIIIIINLYWVLFVYIYQYIFVFTEIFWAIEISTIITPVLEGVQENSARKWWNLSLDSNPLSLATEFSFLITTRLNYSMEFHCMNI